MRHYFQDDPHLYKEGVDGVITRCVPEHEQEQILRKCHSEAYGGYHAGDRTAHKALQSGFHWPTLFKDARKLNDLIDMTHSISLAPNRLVCCYCFLHDLYMFL